MKKNAQTLPRICDKIKHVHMKGLKFTKTKKQQPDVLFLSSSNSTWRNFCTQQEKIWGMIRVECCTFKPLNFHMLIP